MYSISLIEKLQNSLAHELVQIQKCKQELNDSHYKSTLVYQTNEEFNNAIKRYRETLLLLENYKREKINESFD